MKSRLSTSLFLIMGVVVSGCSLQVPRYSTELGGFPIYSGGSSSDRARMYQGIEYRQHDRHDKSHTKASTALLVAR